MKKDIVSISFSKVMAYTHIHIQTHCVYIYMYKTEEQSICDIWQTQKVSDIHLNIDLSVD